MVIISNLLDRILNLPNIKAYRYLKNIKDKHKDLTETHISDKSKPIYYIIRYDDDMSCGWTVWERVVLFGSIYAEKHKMIPVVDMQTNKNIYLEDEEVGSVNAWEKYYEQPGGVSLNDALKSNNYVKADPSQDWFVYLRLKNPEKTKSDFLRDKYSKYIKLKKETVKVCQDNLQLASEGKKTGRMLGLCVRGSDYILFNHPVQPKIDLVVEEAKNIFQQYNCDCYFIATEDYYILQELKAKLPNDKIITYDAGNIKTAEGYIGEQIRRSKSAHQTATDYLTTLYILNKCVCLIGGRCGATIVAQYRKNPPYEYLNIID